MDWVKKTALQASEGYEKTDCLARQGMKCEIALPSLAEPCTFPTNPAYPRQKTNWRAHLRTDSSLFASATSLPPSIGTIFGARSSLRMSKTPSSLSSQAFTPNHLRALVRQEGVMKSERTRDCQGASWQYWFMGYDDAIDDVIAVLESRGILEREVVDEEMEVEVLAEGNGRSVERPINLDPAPQQPVPATPQPTLPDHAPPLRHDPLALQRQLYGQGFGQRYDSHVM